MSALTPQAGDYFHAAHREAGNSTDATAYALVAAIKGLAHEIAALREAYIAADACTCGLYETHERQCAANRAGGEL